MPRRTWGGGYSNDADDSIILSDSGNSSTLDMVDIEHINDRYYVFANGHPIEVSGSETNNTVITPTETTINNLIDPSTTGVTVENDNSKVTFSADISKNLVIFGGAKNTAVDSSNITMTGGTVKYLYGGGSGISGTPSSVSTASIIITGGTITDTVYAGGSNYSTVTNATVNLSGAAVCKDVMAGGANEKSAKDENGISTSVNSVTNVTITVSDEVAIGINGNSGGLYGGGMSFAHVEKSTLNVSGGDINLLVAGGSNGVTDSSTINISGNAAINYLFSVNRGVIEDSTLNVKEDFTGTIGIIALGALSDWDNDGNNIPQFQGGSTDGAVIGSVTLDVKCAELKSSNTSETQVFLGRGLYSNYGNSEFTCDDASYYQHYAYSFAAPSSKDVKALETPVSANVTVSGNVKVIAYVGNTTNSYDSKIFVIDNNKEWTFENGAVLEFNVNENMTTWLIHHGKLSFNAANVGDNGLRIDLDSKSTGDVFIKDTIFKTKGLTIYRANNITITGCTFEGITDSTITDGINAIYLEHYKGNITIGGENKADGNTIKMTLGENGSSINYDRAIFLAGGSQSIGSTITIKNNTISDAAYNAMQIYTSVADIIVEHNTIENWDSNDDSAKDPQTGDGAAGGRAVRIALDPNEGSICPAITISNNTFIKKYIVNAFVSNLGDAGSDVGYDNGNILKITVKDGATLGSLTALNNILALTGIEDTYYGEYQFFLIDDKNANSTLTMPKVVIFDPTDGYYYESPSGVLCSLVAENEKIPEPTPPSRSGSYALNGWYNGDIKWDFDNDLIGSDNLTLTAKWTYNGGSGTPITPPTPPVTPEEPKEPIVPDDQGNAEIKVDEKKAEELVHEAVTSGSNSVTLVDKENIEGTVTSVTIPVSDLETISKQIENNENVNSVSIATSAGEVIIEKEVLNDIIENTNAETIVVEVVDAKDQLNEEQKKTVGDNPVYDVNIHAGDEKITSFNGKTITISIPYELKDGEDPNNLVVYYLKDDGTVEKMKGTYKDGQVSFETDHLSKFVIAYEVQEPVTPDNPDKPAKEDNDNTLYYIVAAIVVIVIIVALAYYFLKKKQ